MKIYVSRGAAVFLKALLILALLFSGCSSPAGPASSGSGEPAGDGTPVNSSPLPSVIRGDGRLLVSWPAKTGTAYEVWYGISPDSVNQWQTTFTGTGTITTTITGLTNGTQYQVWVTKTGEALGTGIGERPEAPKTAPQDFVYIPGGTVTGSSDYAITVTVPNDPAYNNPGASSVKKGVFTEGRTVPIDSFAMAKYETTRTLWYTVAAWALANGYQFQNPNAAAPGGSNGNLPVTGISWRDAIVWCNAYSQKEGKEPVYRSGGSLLKNSTDAAACDNAVMDKTKNGYRLPTEVEREFAARGGDPGQAAWMFTYAGSNAPDTVAWHHGNSPFQTKPVGTKTANSLGIYDLSGNVQEWCWDWMDWAVDVTTATPVDGAYHGTMASQKPFNGGGAGSNVTMSSVVYRWGYEPGYTDGYVGFRVVCKP